MRDIEDLRHDIKSADYCRFTDIIEVNGRENKLQYKIFVKIPFFTPNTSLKVNSLYGLYSIFTFCLDPE